jgi:hypothetical protein
VARWYELRYVWLLARSGEWLIVNCKELRYDCMVTSYNGWMPMGIVKRSDTAGFEIGPPGYGSVSQRYRPRSGKNPRSPPTKIERKTFIPALLRLLYDFFSLKNYVCTFKK